MAIKHLLIVVLFCSHAFANGESFIQTDKIQLSIHPENTSSWIHGVRYDPLLELKTNNRLLLITVYTDIPNIVRLGITDAQSKKCKKPFNVQMDLLFIHFKAISFTGNITTKIQEPCAMTNEQGSHIVLEVKLQNDKGHNFYNTFKLTY